PLREHGHPPRRPDVCVARTAARPPLPGPHPPGDAARAPRDRARRRARGLGAPASRALGHRRRMNEQTAGASRAARRLLGGNARYLTVVGRLPSVTVRWIVLLARRMVSVTLSPTRDWVTYAVRASKLRTLFPL